MNSKIFCVYLYVYSYRSVRVGKQAKMAWVEWFLLVHPQVSKSLTEKTTQHLHLGFCWDMIWKSTLDA